MSNGHSEGEEEVVVVEKSVSLSNGARNGLDKFSADEEEGDDDDDASTDDQPDVIITPPQKKTLTKRGSASKVVAAATAKSPAAAGSSPRGSLRQRLTGKRRLYFSSSLFRGSFFTSRMFNLESSPLRSFFSPCENTIVKF